MRLRSLERRVLSPSRRCHARVLRPRVHPFGARCRASVSAARTPRVVDALALYAEHPAPSELQLRCELLHVPELEAVGVAAPASLRSAR